MTTDLTFSGLHLKNQTNIAEVDAASIEKLISDGANCCGKDMKIKAGLWGYRSLNKQSFTKKSFSLLLNSAIYYLHRRPFYFLHRTPHFSNYRCDTIVEKNKVLLSVFLKETRTGQLRIDLGLGSRLRL